MTPLPGETLEEAYNDVVNVVPTQARAIAALLRETSDRASVSCAALLTHDELAHPTDPVLVVKQSYVTNRSPCLKSATTAPVVMQSLQASATD